MPTDAPSSPGGPWPEAQYGEVYGPSGERCYLSKQAGRLAGGKTDKWAKGLLSSNVVAGEKEVSGHRRVFLHAASFEAYGRQEGWWPPTAVPGDSAESTWELLLRQGSDLEQVRKELAEALHERDRLRREIASITTSNNELLEMVERLARMARSQE